MLLYKDVNVGNLDGFLIRSEEMILFEEVGYILCWEGYVFNSWWKDMEWK